MIEVDSAGAIDNILIQHDYANGPKMNPQHELMYNQKKTNCHYYGMS